MDKEKRIKTNKRIFKIFGIIIGIPIVLAILISLFGGSSNQSKENPTPTDTAVQVTSANWDSLSYDQKQTWIEKTIRVSNENSLDFEYKLKQLVKSKFNYPEEVDFNLGEIPRLNKGEVTDADAGYVFFHGGGTAKNAFGVKSKFTYSIRTIIKPDTTIIDDVTVSTPK